MIVNAMQVCHRCIILNDRKQSNLSEQSGEFFFPLFFPITNFFILFFF